MNLAAPLQATLTELLRRRQAFPHALLLQAPPGHGATELAEALAHALLCDTPATDGTACGTCVACTWLAAGTHPDLLVLRPGEGEDDAAREKKRELGRTGPIRIEAVRQMIETLTLVPHHGPRRVVVIDPADALNPASANALLKVLEEPPPGNVLLLVNHHPQRLLATVRSRCVPVRLPRLAGTVSPDLPPGLVDFLQSPQPDEDALARWPSQRSLLEQLARGERVALPTATRIAGLTLPAALEVLSRWLHDLARVQAGAAPRFLPSMAEPLRGVGQRASPQGVLHMATRLAAWQRHAEHPLNAPLTLADILLEYRSELFPPARNAA